MPKKFGLIWKFKFLFNNGFWPDEEHVRLAKWYYQVFDDVRKK